MNKKNSNLIWLTLATGIYISLVVFSAYPAYGEYRQQDVYTSLPEAFFSAAQDGFFPWSAQSEKSEQQDTKTIELTPEEEALGPGYVKAKEEAEKTQRNPEKEGSAAADTGESSNAGSEGTGNVTQGPGTSGNEITSSGEAAPEAGEGEAAVTVSGGPGVVPDENRQASGDGKNSEEPAFETAGAYYFSDACFIGDSFTEGLCCYGQIPKADYYAYQGLNTYSVMKQEFDLPDGGKGTLEQALKQKQYQKIYILLGINELGDKEPESFAAHYHEVISKIRPLQPDALIFIQSIFHTTQKKSEDTLFKNSLINANNEELKKLADNKTVYYLDINPIFDDETGALRADYSGDGVHIKASHYPEWRDYLLKHAIFKDKVSIDREEQQ